jgi:hypothetical protein
MQYTIDRHFYSYFAGASKHEYTHFDTLLDAWNAYKSVKADDFDYDDAWQDTSFRVGHDHSICTHQRRHARSKEAWERLQQSQPQCEWLIFDDIDEGEVVI